MTTFSLHNSPIASSGNGVPSGSRQHFDVIVVGAGPTGLVAAAALARAGHTVAIFERHPTLYNLPRAGHIDDDILRILQGVGCLDPVQKDFFPFLRVPLLGCDGLPLFEIVHTRKSASSFHSGSLYQPVLEQALYEQLMQHKDVATIHLGWTIVGADQDAASVHVRARPTELTAAGSAGTSDEVVFECSYLIAADGAASSIRESLQIEREDFGFNERWLDVDVAYRRACDFGPPAIAGDPKRPHLVMPLGKKHHRFEWQMFPEESATDFSSPAKAWALLAAKGVTTDDVEIVRQAPYTFEYRVAQRWRVGRIFLAGDAAHTMPPCLGQGMCSGIRDAANLGWKLDLVLRGLAHTEILETYETERRPHVKAWADLSLKAGEIMCLTDPVKAAARDTLFRSGTPPAWRPPSMPATGLFDASSHQPVNVAGHVLPQRKIRRGGRIGRFDDLVARGFLLVARNDPRPFLTRGSQAFNQRIGLDYAWLSHNANDASGFTDEEGEYESFFANNGQAAVIARPDRQLFGGVRHLNELESLVTKLQDSLSPRAAGSSRDANLTPCSAH